MAESACNAAVKPLQIMMIFTENVTRPKSGQ
jgi:hypothetical protein